MRTKVSDPLWTIAELANHVAAVLAENFAGVANGRVRDVPDLRAIRYYTTLGLLDRPARLEGRTAYYTKRHLCQLVAIKRLQALGLSLAEVQQRLLGLGEGELEQLADIKEEFCQEVRRTGATCSTGKAEKPARAAEFWKAHSISVSTPASGNCESTQRPQLLTLVPLAAGMSLGLDARRAITADDLAALRAAAEPLRQLLIERRLIRLNSEGGSDDETAPHPDPR